MIRLSTWLLDTLQDGTLQWVKMLWDHSLARLPIPLIQFAMLWLGKPKGQETCGKQAATPSSRSTSWASKPEIAFLHWSLGWRALVPVSIRNWEEAARVRCPQFSPRGGMLLVNHLNSYLLPKIQRQTFGDSNEICAPVTRRWRWQGNLREVSGRRRQASPDPYPDHSGKWLGHMHEAWPFVKWLFYIQAIIARNLLRRRRGEKDAGIWAKLSLTVSHLYSRMLAALW